MFDRVLNTPLNAEERVYLFTSAKENHKRIKPLQFFSTEILRFSYRNNRFAKRQY